MADEKKAKGFAARIGFCFGEERFVGRMRKGRFKVARAEPDDTDFTFTGTPPQLAAVIYGGAPLDSMGFEGDAGLAKKFVTFFPLPPKAKVAG